MDKLRQFKDDLYGQGYDPASFRVSRMVGTSLKSASLKTPHMKEVVAFYAKDPSLPLEEIPLEETVELTLCYFLLSLKKEGTFAKQMAFLQKKLAYANSWEITDCLQQVIQKAPAKDYKPYYRKWVKDKREYARRFAYVYAMRYYKEDDVAFFLDHLVFDERYYVYMAQAWMLATLAITHFEVIRSFLLRPDIPENLRRKTISKMRDSYRISSKQKEIVKQIRDNH
ncbi:MAG: DNA alkylation repair protein [Bacilli bacterium]